MIIRFVILSILLTTGTVAYATDRFLLTFELSSGANKLEQGSDHISRKPHTWNKGLKRSYLKLRCNPRESGNKKLYSTVDYFHGLSVTHQLKEENIVLTVVHNAVQSRLTEIQALSKNECKDLAPVVTTTTETYHFPAKNVINESRPFGHNMTFRATLQSVD